MDTNARIVRQVKALTSETTDDDSLKKMRKGPYVDGYNAAMTKVAALIALIEGLAPKTRLEHRGD